MSYLLGIDSGLTMTKAVVFDYEGHVLGSGVAGSVHNSPHPRWVEQDMERLWEGCRNVVRQAIADAGIEGSEIAGVGLSGYGNGVYLVDAAGSPVRPGIPSLDSRAHEILSRWETSGLAERVFGLNGQRPVAALPPVLLTWLKENEPEALARTRWVLSVKDWLRYRLTGEYATDPTEASCGGFTDVRTQNYSAETFSLYELEEIKGKLPAIVGCAEVAGEVTRETAEATSLVPGTPVVTGAHDVDMSAVGIGCIEPGQLAIVAGTWSINEVVSDRVALDKEWACWNFVRAGSWLNVSGSPASATNLEWFVQQICPAEVERAKARAVSPFDFVSKEVGSVLGEKSEVFYHPFLYGSPHGSEASGGFFGLRAWHGRGHLLRALFEGVAFNHKSHVDALKKAFDIKQARLTGGGARSELWSQMFADVLDLPVEITDVEESGALGAATLAGIGVGVFGSLEEAREKAVRILRVHQPDPERRGQLAEAYETYAALAGTMGPMWSRLG